MSQTVFRRKEKRCDQVGRKRSIAIERQRKRIVVRCAVRMEKYECDRCGACCQGHLIVEADELDVLRELRLPEADPHYAGNSASEVFEILQEDIGKAVIIGSGKRIRLRSEYYECSSLKGRRSNCCGWLRLPCDSSTQDVGEQAVSYPRLDPVRDAVRDRTKGKRGFRWMFVH